jgi:oligopeptide transport system substrate-binding protein
VKRIWLLGLIFTLVIGVLAVGQVKTLYWNLNTEPPTLDPNIATDTTSIQVIQALFLGLTDFDDLTMEVVPELATHWEASADGLTWTFYMRDDVIWTDGTPVTAHQVVYSVKRTLDPATGSSYAYVLWIIEGAQAFNNDEGGTADGVGVPSLGCGSAAHFRTQSWKSTAMRGSMLRTS